ncbi:receptor-type tyrosine-protein phosphatase H-like isoform X2 [Parambassis ranga]|uniref:protein-tyrosine-phosphatase n=1 Tax=Parambassis ranga TaxID=210632 RepID=A0A6P7KJ15_9TELE|nr:receptor-type tyrosine-protein phosphatase H isoform X2 [Parambassis ranga]
MKILSLKSTSNILLLLCLLWSLLLDKTDCNTTVSSTTATTLIMKSPPPNVNNVTVVTQNETTITLRCEKVNNIPTYILKYNDISKEIDASSQGDPVVYVVSSLTAATRYSFTLITKLDNVTSSGYMFTAPTAPNIVKDVKVVKHETSVTLMWDNINNISTYVLQLDNGRIIVETVNASNQTKSVEHKVQNLTAATRYSFTLYAIFEEVRSTGYNFTVVTAPPNVNNVTVLTQNETTIALRWKTVNNSSTYILKYNDISKEIDASSQGDPVVYVVSSLNAATRYSFTLITKFDNVTSSGYSFTALTAPPNVNNVAVLTQNETTIALRWKKVNNSSTYILKYNDITKEIDASSQGDPVVYVVSSLTAATRYSFTLITKLDNVTSSGYMFTAPTAPNIVKDVKVVKHETSVTLMWDNINNISTYVLQLNDDGRIIVETVNASNQTKSVEHKVQNLTAATRYSVTLYAIFEEVRSTGYKFTVVTAPPNVNNVTVLTQNETTIALRWKKVDNSSTYILKYNDITKEIDASSYEDPVVYVVSSLTAATRYSFTLITKFDNVTSSGYSFTALTAPPNVKNVTVVTQSNTTITLRWVKVDNSSTYILKYNDITKEIDASSYEDPVVYVVSSLNAATRYSFTLITKFDNVTSSGYSFNAPTAPRSVGIVNVITRTETIITLRWDNVDDVSAYILQYQDGSSEEKVKHINASQQAVECEVTGLTAGKQYHFTLVAVFESVKSTKLNFTALTVPPKVREVIVPQRSLTSITLAWETADKNWGYLVQQNGINVSVTSDGSLNVTHTVNGLKPGTMYEFKVFTSFYELYSTPHSVVTVTVPPKVREVIVPQRSLTSITLAWETADKNWGYLVQQNGINVSVTSDGSLNVTHTVNGLKPGTMYEFKVFTSFYELYSTPHSVVTVTVPPKVREVIVPQRSLTSITLAWETADKNWGYLVQQNGINVSVTSDGSLNVTHTVNGLKPGTMYEFKVFTSFYELYSTPHSAVTVTAINCSTVNWHITDSSIQGTVEGLFTNATATNHSQVHVSPRGSNVSFTGLYPGGTYEIYLEYETTPKPLPQCRHSLTIRPSALLNARCEYWAGGYSVYIVWDNPVGVLTAVEVNVKDKSSLLHEDDEQHVIIPGFQPAKTYQVTLTSLSGSIRSSYPSVFPCYTDPRGVIAGSLVAVLLFGALVCAAVFLFFKRPDIIRRKKSFISGSRLSIAKSKAISVADFPDHFYQLSLDDKRGFSMEYEALMPVGKDQPQMTALLPENKAKNRFTNVLPYDWCRVKLSTSNQNGTSDYINASYMPGYKNNKQYIATQGPLPSTVNDFWRMIWEQRVKGIVMVTNCVEGGRTKCERYWPADSNACRYGELLVTVRTEQSEPSWTLREFKVEHRNTSEERTVKHFHFTAWPDHNVPECTEVLIQFRGLVRQHIEREGVRTPTVVHCSAGVGRTGTIITLDVLLQQLDKEGTVGINAFVHQMRLNRPFMVQTESQYVFLHQCIMDCLRPKDKSDELIYENVDMIYVNATALRQLR